MAIRILDVRQPANPWNGQLGKRDRAPMREALTQSLLQRRNLHRTDEGLDWRYLRLWGRAAPRQEPAIDAWLIRWAGVDEPVLRWPVPQCSASDNPLGPHRSSALRQVFGETVEAFGPALLTHLAL
jgi:hypothetical protein